MVAAITRREGQPHPGAPASYARNCKLGALPRAAAVLLDRRGKVVGAQAWPAFCLQLCCSAGLGSTLPLSATARIHVGEPCGRGELARVRPTRRLRGANAETRHSEASQLARRTGTAIGNVACDEAAQVAWSGQRLARGWSRCPTEGPFAGEVGNPFAP